jgi:TRAP-type C4-dicarboxylate transport system substrate-binding protein
LTEEQQQIIEKAAKEAAAYEFDLLEKGYEEDKKFLQDNGIKFTTPDKSFSEDMLKASQPVYDDIFAENEWAEELVEKIKAE